MQKSITSPHGHLPVYKPMVIYKTRLMYSSTLCDRCSINFRKAKMLCAWFRFGVGLLTRVFPRNGAQKSGCGLGAEKNLQFFPSFLLWVGLCPALSGQHSFGVGCGCLPFCPAPNYRHDPLF